MENEKIRTRKSFVFYWTFFEATKDLPYEDKCEVIYAIIEYALTGKEPDLDGYLKSIFLVVKPQIDANNKRYENGQLGGRPKKQTSSSDPLVDLWDGFVSMDKNDRILI